MPDYTVYSDVDSMLRSANNAAIRSAIGVGTTDVPVFSGVTATTIKLGTDINYGVFANSNGIGMRVDAALVWYNGSNINGSSADLFLTKDAAGILAQRNGTAKQVHRVYNTFLGTTANEWGGFDWLTTANVLRIGTDHAGTGGARDLQIITNGIARLTIQGNGNASFTNTVGFGGNVNVGYLLGLASLLVSQLPAASGTAIFSLVGVSNSNVTAALGKGTTVVGGGSNKVIVMCDGTNWVIL